MNKGRFKPFRTIEADLSVSPQDAPLLCRFMFRIHLGERGLAWLGVALGQMALISKCGNCGQKTRCLCRGDHVLPIIPRLSPELEAPEPIRGCSSDALQKRFRNIKGKIDRATAPKISIGGVAVQNHVAYLRQFRSSNGVTVLKIYRFVPAIVASVHNRLIDLITCRPRQFVDMSAQENIGPYHIYQPTQRSKTLYGT